MARADLIKKLFIAHNKGDHDLFISIGRSIIEEERKKNHSILANDLDRTLNHYSDSDQDRKYKVPVNVGKDDELVDIFYPSEILSDLVLDDKKNRQIEEIIRGFRNWDLLTSNGVSPVNKIIFYGPPGCGKTLCAKAIASEIGIPLMYVRFDALISSYLGETALNLRKVFERAKDDSYLILLDEFDAIARSRSDATEHGEIKRVVNALLQQIDGFKGRSLIIAATNYEKSLDYAIWRRFDDTIMFEMPSLNEKIEIFKKNLIQFRGPSTYFESIIGQFMSFSHSDIKNITNIIMRNCILRGSDRYTYKDIEKAVAKQQELVSLRKTWY